MFSHQTNTFHLAAHTNVYRDKNISHLVVQESPEFLDHLVFLGLLAIQEDLCVLEERIFSQGLQVDLAAKTQ